jgi:hypothetical protein
MRRSVRNQCLGLNDEQEVDPLQALDQSRIDMSFEYKPQEFEKHFAKDEASKKVQKLAIQKCQALKPKDIKEIIGFLDAEKKLALIVLYPKTEIAISTGQQKVAGYVGKHFKSFHSKCVDGMSHKFLVV